jgi:hypothetical protein
MDSKDVLDTGEVLNSELGDLINERKRLLAELSENAKLIDEVLLTMSLTEGLEDEPCQSKESE